MDAVMVARPAGVVLPPDGTLREPPRPPAEREPGFDDRFDATTLVYDAFESRRHGATLLVCPPLLNLEPAIRDARFTSAATGAELGFRIEHRRLIDVIVVDRSPGDGDIRIESGIGTFEVGPDADRTDLFAGCRTMLTMSKDNELVWLQDWMRFHRDVHGADALLLYDNASTTYTNTELAEALSQVAGFRQVRIVEWPYRYGPQGDAHGRHWDCFYSQLGMLEAARHHYLGSAAAVMMADPDELVVPLTGTSVFDAARVARSGVVAYHGLWVPTFREHTTLRPVRHRDFLDVERPQWGRRFGVIPTRRYFENKWTAVPERMPDDAQWLIHAILGVLRSRWASRRFWFAHYRAISTSWKYDRAEVDVRDRRRHRRPRSLRRALERVDWDR